MTLTTCVDTNLLRMKLAIEQVKMIEPFIKPFFAFKCSGPRRVVLNLFFTMPSLSTCPLLQDPGYK